MVPTNLSPRAAVALSWIYHTIPVDDLSRSVRAMVDDLSGDLMAHDTGAGERELAFQDVEIGVADPAGCTKLVNTTMSDGDARNQISSSK